MNNKLEVQQDTSNDICVLIALARNARQKLAEDPATPQFLICLLSRDQDESVRLAAAENPSLPYTSLSKLVHDPSADLRLALAENHSMPVPILNKLAQDENPYVACRAQTTLERCVKRDNIVEFEAFVSYIRYDVGS